MSRAPKYLLSALCVAGMAATTRAQVKLEPKYQEGSTVTVEATSKTHQVLTINGMDIETDAENVTTESRAVGRRKADGGLPVNVKVESLKADLNLNGQTISFDSSAPPPKDVDPQLSFIVDIFRIVAGSTYTIELDAKDQVVSVEGVDKLIEKAAELNPTAAEMIKDQVSLERIRRDIQQDRARYPDILVREGESWDRTESQNLGGGQTLTFEKRYEYLGTTEKDGKTLDKIGVKVNSVTYAMEPNSASPLKVEKSDLKVESSDGTILFDREAGRAVEESLVTRIKGTLALSIMGQSLDGELDLTLDRHDTTRAD